MAQRFEGRNLEEALGSAAAALGAERFQLKYAVVSEKRGFLGGVKRMVIEVSVDPTLPPPAEPALVHVEPVPVVAAAAPPPEDYFEQPKEAPERAPRQQGRGVTRRPDDNRREDNRRGDRGRPKPPRDFDDDDLLVQGEETPGASAARAWCERLISLAGLSVIIRSEQNEEAITLRLHGRDVRSFTDEHGELLDAVQVLANKALVGRSVPLPIELQAGSFKEHREKELAATAQDAADRVRRSGREELLPAMTPIERRIVHVALHDDADVTTESRGEGFLKRIAVVRRTAASAPGEP